MLLAMACMANTATATDEGKELKAKVYLKDGKFNIATTNGKFRLWFDNRIYTDASIYIPTESVEGLTSKTNKDLEEDDGLPTLLFTHDPPEAEAKHFTNPRKPNDINPEDGFQNLLSDTCTVRDTDARPKGNWRVLEDFIADHPEIRAYFHGDCNYNEFYTWKGVDGRISLPVFRVDSPMKGEYSSEDETLLSFIVVTIDTGTRLLTARECLWNTGMRPGIKWGESATVRLGR